MTKLQLNGETIAVDAIETTPLAYVLRNECGIKSVKLGCEAEQCGACTILADDRPVPSCTLALSDASERRLTTLEGLARGDVLSAVQNALLTSNASQCGYCLSGIAVAAYALFQSNAHPTHNDIVNALDGHLCRCGAHPRVIRALEQLAK